MDNYSVRHLRSVLLIGSIWMVSLAMLAIAAAVSTRSPSLGLFTGFALVASWLLASTWVALGRPAQRHAAGASSEGPSEGAVDHRRQGEGPKAA